MWFYGWYITEINMVLLCFCILVLDNTMWARIDELISKPTNTNSESVDEAMIRTGHPDHWTRIEMGLFDSKILRLQYQYQVVWKCPLFIISQSVTLLSLNGSSWTLDQVSYYDGLPFCILANFWLIPTRTVPLLLFR